MATMKRYKVECIDHVHCTIMVQAVDEKAAKEAAAEKVHQGRHRAYSHYHLEMISCEPKPIRLCRTCGGEMQEGTRSPHLFQTRGHCLVYLKEVMIHKCSFCQEVTHTYHKMGPLCDLIDSIDFENHHHKELHIHMVDGEWEVMTDG